MAWLALPYIWLPSGTSTIGWWPAAEAFQQCSRDTPQPDGAYWLPSATDIAELESELWPMLEQRDKLGQTVPPRFQQFRRQYVGFTHHGERLIYGNFSAWPENEPWREWALLERPVSVCDGGRSFWGIVYKPPPLRKDSITAVALPCKRSGGFMTVSFGSIRLLIIDLPKSV